MSGKVIAIYCAAESGGALSAQSSATLEAGRGIVGDRYWGRDPDAQITLVDADVIDRINAETGWSLAPEQTRRNVVTRGVDLNRWERGRFRIGDAVLEGVELCEPCAGLGALLATADRSAAQVVRALAHRGGVRARIVVGGRIRPGDVVCDLVRQPGSGSAPPRK
jgi:MOSC domain-containing protein YiiM